MTQTQIIWLFLGLSWTLIEIVIAVKTRVHFSSAGGHPYRSEVLIWLAVIFAVITALWFKQQQWTPLPIDVSFRQLLAIPLFISGLALRAVALLNLGKFFSTTVITHTEHQLIETGPYRWLRHPAYTGLLISFFAAGLAMGDVLAFVVLLSPITFALYRRIQIEEQWLLGHFGDDYSAYCQRTKALIPWVY
jgi:protein-S-isoprenylcysteine O-methyltransferase Ste14